MPRQALRKGAHLSEATYIIIIISYANKALGAI
jgi:hypothetical protein